MVDFKSVNNQQVYLRNKDGACMYGSVVPEEDRVNFDERNASIAERRRIEINEMFPDGVPEVCGGTGEPIPEGTGVREVNRIGSAAGYFDPNGSRVTDACRQYRIEQGIDLEI